MVRKVLHGAAAAFLVARGHVVADNAGIVLVAPAVRILHVDAEAGEEALVAQHADRRLADGEIEHGDLRVGCGIAQGRLRPLADQLARLEVVGGERRVGRVDRLQGRVEGDHQDAGIARLLDAVDDRLGVGGGDQDSLGAVGDAGLDGRHLALVVAVDLAGIGLQIDAELGRLGGGAFLHLDEEGVGVGLGDEAGRDVGCHRRCGGGHGEHRAGKHQFA